MTTEPTEGLSAAQQHGRYLLALTDAADGDPADLDKIAPAGTLPPALQQMAQGAARADLAAGRPGDTPQRRRWTTDPESVTRRRLAAAYWAEVDRLGATR